MLKNANIVGEWLTKNNKGLGHSQQKVTLSKSKQKLEGFGGWLALFGLGVFAVPILIVLQLILEPRDYDAPDVFLNVFIILLYVWLDYLMINKKSIQKWFLWGGIFQIVVTGLIVLAANVEISLYTQEELSDLYTSLQS